MHIFLVVCSSLLVLNSAKVVPDAVDENEEYMVETRADLFEGDIELDEFRNIVPRDSMAWPGGVVPYVIDFSGIQFITRNTIQSAMDEIEAKSAVNGNKCIKFVPRSNQRNYIKVTSGSGCSSRVGVSGGAQTVKLALGCRTKGIVMHELLHALGFWHEQSRPDRDQYVQIMWDNIQDGKAFNFNKYSHSRTFGTPYDYGSIMHYGKYSFAKGGLFGKKPTIVPKDSSKSIGQRKRLSENDIRKIRLLYKCSGSRPVVTTTKATPTTTGECTNLRGDDYCKDWAGKGKCTAQENAAWMKIFCTKACNTCPPDSCKNKHDSAECLKWTQNGECYKNPNWMSANCSRTCNTC